jgi:hypothetical protein
MHNLHQAAKTIFAVFILLFLTASLAMSYAIIGQGRQVHHYFLLITSLLLVAGIFKPNLTKIFINISGITIVCFGFQGYTLPSRVFEHEIICLTIILLVHNRQRILSRPFSIMDWAFWLFPVIALSSVLIPLGPTLLETHQATGALGLARLITGSPAASPFYAMGSAWWSCPR